MTLVHEYGSLLPELVDNRVTGESLATVALPLVSVVIPTIRRPDLVVRAIESVLAQTMGDLEIVVVIDGPDADTASALQVIHDPRLRIEHRDVAQGSAAARNHGVSQARGAWVAFLDDDDEWLPHKLERQLAGLSPEQDVLVVSRCYAITAITTYLWPRVIFDNDESLGDYLFKRRSFTLGESYFQTSTWLVPRRLLLDVPFRALRFHEDWDVSLRLFTRPGMRLVTIEEPLVNHYIEDSRQSLGRTGDWRASLDWIDSMRHLVGKQAYAGFLTTVVAQKIVTDKARRHAPELLFRTLTRGRPTLTHLMLLGSILMLPPNVRRHARSIAKRMRLA